MSDPTTPEIPLLEPAEEGAGKAEPSPAAQGVLHLLRHFALTQRQPRHEFSEFAGFVKLNLGRFLLKLPQLQELTQRTDLQLTMHLRVLAERGLCQLEYDGPEIKGIRYNRYFADELHKAYANLEQRPLEPFPNEKTLGFKLPADLVLDVSLQSDFVNVLTQPSADAAQILRFGFPDALPELLITSELVKRKLLELCLAKMREFLGARNNAGYVLHRLLPALRGNEHVLRDTISSIVTKSSRAINSLTDPSDFSFRFWAHFANLVVQEFRERTDRNQEETGHCQAAYLIGYYNVFFRGQTQTESEKSVLLKRFEVQFRKAPYAYTIRDLYGVKDDKGLPLIRAASQELFVKFLEERTRFEEGKGLPALVRLNTVSGQEYYLARELIIPFFLKRLYDRRDQIREQYIDAWSGAIKEGRRIPSMYADEEFLSDLEAALKNLDPLLHALLNYHTLYLAKEAAKLNHDQLKDLGRCLDEKLGRVAPLDQVFRLPRRELLEDAKLRVPVWQRFPLFKKLVNWFQELMRRFRGEAPAAGRHTAKAAAAPRTAAGSRGREGIGPREEPGTTVASPVSARQLAAYKTAIQTLKIHFVGREKSISERLGELAEKWNPLYDPKSRTDLVEDVNSMVRDYLRSLRRGFRIKPPDAARIQALAVQVSQNKAFDRIKRKDLFVRYIEVFMIKVLSEG